MESINVFNSIRYRITPSRNSNRCNTMAGVKPKITFWCDPFYAGIEKPIPAVQSVPSWFKSMPALYDTKEKYPLGRKNAMQPTLKQCPGFIDFYKYGYIIRSWTDTTIEVREDGWWRYSQALEEGPTGAKWTEHPPEQCANYMPNVKVVLKIVTPWHILTTKGYSILQLPLMWESNKDWEVAGGVNDTDTMHQVNFPILFKNTGTWHLPTGTPLAMFIPFKRETFEYSVPNRTEYLKTIQDKMESYIRRTWGPIQGFRNRYKRLRETNE